MPPGVFEFDVSSLETSSFGGGLRLLQTDKDSTALQRRVESWCERTTWWAPNRRPPVHENTCAGGTPLEQNRLHGQPILATVRVRYDWISHGLTWPRSRSGQPAQGGVGPAMPPRGRYRGTRRTGLAVGA